MDILLALVFGATFLGVLGLGIYFALVRRTRRRMAQQFPFRRYDDDELPGEKRHCDAYSAGTFYW
ncbi:MAG: hypothetical protein H6R01_1566 [Burkholderiaceae bacterium]|nr:hypothetical protein [Burkholderiaceae bacterium]